MSIQDRPQYTESVQVYRSDLFQIWIGSSLHVECHVPSLLAGSMMLWIGAIVVKPPDERTMGMMDDSFIPVHSHHIHTVGSLYSTEIVFSRGYFEKL